MSDCRSEGRSDAGKLCAKPAQRDGQSFHRKTRHPYRTFWSSLGLLRFLGPFLDDVVDVHHQKHHRHRREVVIP